MRRADRADLVKRRRRLHVDPGVFRIHRHRAAIRQYDGAGGDGADNGRFDTGSQLGRQADGGDGADQRAFGV